MLVVIPYHRGDKPLAVQLAAHIAQLGGASKHDCLLAVHKDTDSSGVIESLQKAFGRVAEFQIADDMIIERDQHAYAANLMWKRTANHIADMSESQPWLWLEPDATPLTPDWLDSLDRAYGESGRPFLHTLVETPRGKSNSGCGVYPAKVRDYTDRLWELSNVSWDVLLYPDFAPHTAYTPLIQDIGFIPGTKELPTFSDAASLSILRPGAALFHRCKDGSLIERLGGQSGRTSTQFDAVVERMRSEFTEIKIVNKAAEFAYNFEDLKRLRECLACNNGRISSALVAFGSVTLPFLEFAERIKDDSDFPEKHFGQFVARAKPASSKSKSATKRTPEEQAKIEARMAKARAARKTAA